MMIFWMTNLMRTKMTKKIRQMSKILKLPKVQVAMLVKMSPSLKKVMRKITLIKRTS